MGIRMKNPFTKKWVMKLLKEYYEDKKKRERIRFLKFSNYIVNIEICKNKTNSWNDETILIMLKHLIEDFDLKKIEKNIWIVGLKFKILKKVEKGEYAYYFARCFDKYLLVRTKIWTQKEEGDYMTLFRVKFENNKRVLEDSSGGLPTFKILSTDREKIKRELILLGVS